MIETYAIDCCDSHFTGVLPAGSDEMMALTIAARVEKELALTPSPVPPSVTPTQIPSATPTDQPTATITETPIPTATPDFLAGYPQEGYGPLNFPARGQSPDGIPDRLTGIAKPSSVSR